MRALITGINGFVGGHLADYVLATGDWEVWGVGRQRALKRRELCDRVTYISADLEQPAAAEKVLAHSQPAYIFHLAGQAFVPQSFEDPERTLSTNMFAALHLFKGLLALKLDATVLVAGSNEEYGRVRPQDIPINEDTPLQPVSPYAVSKIAQDYLALQYHLSHGLKTIRVRPFNHIGPGQDERFAVASFAQQIARIEVGAQEPILRVGNLTAQRDFTDVRDMVRAYALAVLRGTPGAVYNIGSGRAVSMRDILDMLLRTSEHHITVQSDPARMRPADVPLVVCDNRRFQEATGWQPHISLEQTIHDLLAYYRQRVRE